MSQNVASSSSTPDSNNVIEDLKTKNDELVSLLSSAKLQLLNLKDQVEALGSPPSGFGILLDLFENDATATYVECA